MIFQTVMYSLIGLVFLAVIITLIYTKLKYGVWFKEDPVVLTDEGVKR